MDRDVTVRLIEDADTLKDYNFERFRNRTALYYVLPSEKMYSFPAGPDNDKKVEVITLFSANSQSEGI
ncbi:DUF4973 domain-containing protein [Bacteroides thetaiotaomicron]|uniref:DUF4973 domain-containing protein n=1 Tax=Bacteroides thetaiotaomicron TaxID=818 RepID=UPI0035B060C3